MKNFKKIIPLNSENQNEVLVWYCLEHSEIEKFKQLLRDDMPLNAFMLTSMVFLDYTDDVIKEVLKSAVNLKDNVFTWLKNHFEATELSDVLPLYEQLLPKDYPSNDECVELKLWKALYNRGEYGLVARNAPQILEQRGGYWADIALLNANFEKYAPQCLERERYNSIIAVKEGWKYLIDHGQAQWVLQKAGSSFKELLPYQECVDYCLQKELYEDLYAAKCYDALLEHQKFEIFVKHHSSNPKFLTEHPDKVDWDDLWEQTDDKLHHKYLKEKAFCNRNVSQCNEFLWKHAGLLDQIRLYIS